MSVEVTVFSPVEVLLAVTVAPGMSEFPDFTTPEIEKAGAGGAVCPSEAAPNMSRIATRGPAAASQVRNQDAAQPVSEQSFILCCPGEWQKA